MKVLEIISFMNPLSDGLSTLFVGVIVLASIGTWLFLEIYAKDYKWEENWENGDWHNDTSGLDSYGSVHELSEIVATKSEKVAVIMPSLLLVVGLLGTFIGLGMALNNASNVLASIDTVGIDGAMGQLTGMMEGLGAKFKTSTWGILCFVLLNILFNARAYDDRRLEWVIGKIQEDSQEKQKRNAGLEEKKYNGLIGAIKAIQNDNNQQQERLASTLHNLVDKVLQSSNNNNQSLITEIKNSIDLLDKNTCFAIQSVSDAITNIEKAVNVNHKNLVDNLVSNIEFINENIAKAIIGLSENLDSSSRSIEDTSKQTLVQLEKIADYNEATQRSMSDFVDKTVDSMASIGDSAKQMGDAATAVGSSARELNAVIENLQGELAQVVQMIKEDLGDTIADMGQSFEQNMGNMASTMEEATTGIAQSVKLLSSSIDNTLTSTQQAIESSMGVQADAITNFDATADTLNEQTIKVTTLVEKLTNDLQQSLRSVATANKQISSLVKGFESVSQKDERLTNSVAKLAESIEQSVKDEDKNDKFAVFAQQLDLLSTISDKISQHKDLFDHISTEVAVLTKIEERLSELNSTILEEKFTEPNSSAQNLSANDKSS